MDGYEVKLTPTGEASLLRLEPRHREFVATHLAFLARSPTRLARPPLTPPYPPGGMVYEFDLWEWDERHHFAAFFRYGQDEATLFVFFIAHARLEIWP